MKFFRWQCWNPDSQFLMKQIQVLILMPLRIVADGVNKLRNKDNAVLVVTHYQRLLDYIVPDFVHVLYNGGL